MSAAHLTAFSTYHKYISITQFLIQARERETFHPPLVHFVCMFGSLVSDQTPGNTQQFVSTGTETRENNKVKLHNSINYYLTSK